MLPSLEAHPPPQRRGAELETLTLQTPALKRTCEPEGRESEFRGSFLHVSWGQRAEHRINQKEISVLVSDCPKQ